MIRRSETVFGSSLPSASSEKSTFESPFSSNLIQILPVMVMIVSNSLTVSLSSSLINFTIPLSRSTEKYGPEMLYETFRPSGSTPESRDNKNYSKK